MPKNTGVESKRNDFGESVVIDLEPYIIKLRTLYHRHHPEVYKQFGDFLKLMLDIGKSFIDRGYDSATDIVHDWTESKREYMDVLCIATEFEQMLRDSCRGCFRKGYEPGMPTIPHDTTVMTIQFLKGKRNETGFERYIERCRRDGDAIHPELDRALRVYRCTYSRA